MLDMQAEPINEIYTPQKTPTAMIEKKKNFFPSKAFQTETS